VRAARNCADEGQHGKPASPLRLDPVSLRVPLKAHFVSQDQERPPTDGCELDDHPIIRWRTCVVAEAERE